MPELRLHACLDEIPAAAWDALHDGGQPFISHAFLAGLEQHGCVQPRWGWQPLHASLWQHGALVAAAPGYLKANSHGEFVFDHVWADAFARHGLAYYPKWLLAVPYTPVTGPRLLARAPEHARALAAALGEETARRGLSSLHVNFLPEADATLLDSDWLARCDVQYHWQRRAHWSDFEAFLADLTHKKRKNIRAERTGVRRAGFGFRVLHGDEASAADLAAMHVFYQRSFVERGNLPALTPGFFRHLAQAMPRALLLVLAIREGRREAGALFLRGGGRLYGRYWGSLVDCPGLHFETCYYQGIEYCLRERLDWFEPGAQGEHKIARGFLPVITASRHLVRAPAFAAALEPWCARERASVLAYSKLLRDRSPYRDAPDPAAGRSERAVSTA